MPSPEKSDPNDNEATKRPVCPTCGVPMWLAKIVISPGHTLQDRYYFECKVCTAQAILPPLDE